MLFNRSLRRAVCGVVFMLALAATGASGQDVAEPDTAPQGFLGGDSVPDLIVTPNSGAMYTTIIDGATLAPIVSGFPFGPGFPGGARAALGDLTGDGVADIVVGMGPGGGLVTLLNGANAALIGSGMPFGAFGGGVNVALGHFNGDSRLDIVTAQASGGGTVTVFNSLNYTPILSLRPFGDGYTGGINVATGDIDGDGRTDLLLGQANGPLVSVVSGATHTVVLSGVPFGGSGVFVAAGDVTGDGRAEIIAAPAQGAGPVMVFDVRTLRVLRLIAPYDASVTGGVRIAAADLNGDGRTEIVTVPGPGSPAQLRVIDGATLTVSRSAPAYPASFVNGAFIAIANLPPLPTLRFSSAATATFTVGTASSFTVQVTGATGTTTLTSTGALPPGVTFVDNGNGTATLSGTPGGTAGSFPLTFRAQAGAGAPVTQAFVLTVQQPPAITSVASTTFTVGVAGTFTVTTTGAPAPTLSVTGGLPTGVTFTPHADGTATLAGTPGAGSGGTYSVTITASSAAGSPATQAFTLIVNQTPTFTSAASTSFTTGVAGSFTVTTSAVPDATVSVTGTLPAGVTFTPHADGTATLAGTPGAGTGGTYPLTISASNGVGGAVTQAFSLTVRQAPAITSAASAAFTVGAAGSFTITSTGSPAPTVSASGTLPTGVTFVAGANGTATLAGMPAHGTAGTYTLTITAANGVGAPATQSFTLAVTTTVVAQDDTYTGAIGNTQFSVGGPAPSTPAVVVAGSLLDNDAATATPLTLAVTVPPAHGQVVVANNGTFLYTPTAGFTGPSDAFTYSVTDAHGVSDTAVATIGLSGIVWYVDASAGGGGSGRSQAPFNTIPAALAAAGNGPIHVAAGSYPGTLTMLPGQRLWGAGSAFVLGGLTLPATTNPVLTGSVILAAGVQLNSLSVSSSGVAISGGSGVSGTVALTGVSILAGTVGLNLTNVPGTVTITGGAFSGVSGAEVLIDGGAGTIAIGATITSTAGRSIDVKNRTAGTVTFAGAVTDSGDGILLANNTGSTVAFTGGVNVTTTITDAFAATGGGTVVMTQDNTTIVNTLTTAFGTALRIENTNIGAAGVTVRSITAGTTSDSPGVGIVLDDTGAAGRLLVSGNGPLPNGTPLGTPPTGGRVRNKTGADGSTTSGIGIYLNATLNPSFHWMEVTGFENSGIYGLNVSGFELADSLVAGAGTTAALFEGPIVFGQPISVDHPAGIGGLTGTGLIRNSVIRNGFEHNVLLFNNQPGTTLSMRIDRTNGVDGGCQIGPNSTTNGGDGLFVKVEGTAAAAVTVDQCRMRSNRLAGIRANAVGASNLTMVLSNSEANAAEQGTDGIVVTNGSNAAVTTTISSNVFNGFPGSGVRVGQDALSASAASSFHGTISNNSVFHPQNSTDAGIAARLSSSPGVAAPTRLRLEGNFVSQRGTPAGIQITTPDATATPRVDVTLTTNHVDMEDPASPSTPGARGPFGIVLAVDHVDATFGLCANVTSNTTHWYPPGVGVGGGFQVSRAGSAQLRLERGIRALGEAFDVVLRENNAAGPAGASAVTLVGTFSPANVVENNSCLVP